MYPNSSKELKKAFENFEDQLRFVHNYYAEEFLDLAKSNPNFDPFGPDSRVAEELEELEEKTELMRKGYMSDFRVDDTVIVADDLYEYTLQAIDKLERDARRSKREELDIFKRNVREIGRLAKIMADIFVDMEKILDP